jgi:hypothetical protein
MDVLRHHTHRQEFIPAVLGVLIQNSAVGGEIQRTALIVPALRNDGVNSQRWSGFHYALWPFFLKFPYVA